MGNWLERWFDIDEEELNRAPINLDGKGQDFTFQPGISEAQVDSLSTAIQNTGYQDLSQLAEDMTQDQWLEHQGGDQQGFAGFNFGGRHNYKTTNSGQVTEWPGKEMIQHHPGTREEFINKATVNDTKGIKLPFMDNKIGYTENPKLDKITAEEKAKYLLNQFPNSGGDLKVLAQQLGQVNMKPDELAGILQTVEASANSAANANAPAIYQNDLNLKYDNAMAPIMQSLGKIDGVEDYRTKMQLLDQFQGTDKKKVVPSKKKVIDQLSPTSVVSDTSAFDPSEYTGLFDLIKARGLDPAEQGLSEEELKAYNLYIK